MTFKEVLYEVVSWIEKDQRVSYRAIKRQFSMVDDEYLEDLKDAILYAHPIELEERGFVWSSSSIGNAGRESRPSIDPVATTAKAERRRISVMFCDLQDSTQLAQQLDPEELRDIIMAYQAAAANVIQLYGGYIAQYLGDGLLVYFGWPKAQENDAERAVLTGLGITEAIASLAVQSSIHIELAVRIGIHTGLVVVGEMGGQGRQETLATGDTVNIAARLEGLAKPNTVVISEATHRLIYTGFELESLGMQTLKGVKDSLPVYEVVGTKGRQRITMGNVDSKRGPFLVGRDEEVGLMIRRWEQSKRGLGQIVTIAGNAGIGKSSLVESIDAHVKAEGHQCILIRCSAYHQNSAYFPLIRAIEDEAQLEPMDAQSDRYRKLELYLQSIELASDTTFPFFCNLLSLEPGDQYEYYNSITPQKRKQLTSDALVSWLFRIAQIDSLLTIWEDLHWADPSTLEVAGQVTDQIPTVPMLAVYTFRPQFFPKWRQHSHITPITLSRLELRQTKALIKHLSDQFELPGEVVDHIVLKTDGVPLFIEELTKMLLESSILQNSENQYTLKGSLNDMSIPDTLQESLMARLDQLQSAKEIAQLGSVIGREFSYESIEAVHSGPASELEVGLNELLSTELLYVRGRPPESVYTFKHALVQDAAYNTLLKSQRQKIHLNIAQFIEARRLQIGHHQPELIAHHYTEALEYEKALEFWLQAGLLAKKSSSLSEAIAHLHKGLQIVSKHPDPLRRIDFELDFQLALGPCLIATRGYAYEGVGDAFQRARELATEIGDPEKMFAVLWGMCSHNIVRANHEVSLRVGQDLQAVPMEGHDGYEVVRGISLGLPLYSLTRFDESYQQFSKGIPTYKKSHHEKLARQFGMDMGIFGRAAGSHAAWQVGQLDTALKWSNHSLEFAVELDHPFTLAVSRAYASMLHQFRRDISAAEKYSTDTIRLSTDQQFPYYLAWGVIINGWCIGSQGEPGSGLTQIQDGLALLRETGSLRGLPYYLSLMAEMQALSGQETQALTTLERALVEASTINEHWWTSQLHRLSGDYLLLLEPSDHNAVKLHYLNAIKIAQKQGARTLELRATLSLAQLYCRQQQFDLALDLVRPLYETFTEDHESHELKEVREFMESLN